MPMPLDIKQSFNKSFSFANISLNEFETAFVKIIKSQGFEIKERLYLRDTVNIKAAYGSYNVLPYMLFIPWRIMRVARFISKQLPWGGRAYLDASISSGKCVNMNISITPLTSFYNEQVDRDMLYGNANIADQYCAVREMHLVLKSLFLSLNLEIPDELSKFDSKSSFMNFFLVKLIYLSDSNKFSKYIHHPPGIKSPWCWGGFIIPEVWFIWHEIWGVGICAILIPAFICAGFAEFQFWNHYSGTITITTLVVIRIFLGIFGNRIFYAKYGYFPHEKKHIKPGSKKT